MGRKYVVTVGDRVFLVGKDYFGCWSVWSAYDDGEIAVGVPPFSVGHRTKKDAVEFIRSFEDAWTP